MQPIHWVRALVLLAAMLLLAGCPSRGPYRDPPPHRDTPRRGYALPRQALQLSPVSLAEPAPLLTPLQR